VICDSCGRKRRTDEARSSSFGFCEKSLEVRAPKLEELENTNEPRGTALEHKFDSNDSLTRSLSHPQETTTMRQIQILAV
jgi:hypothetical protein